MSLHVSKIDLVIDESVDAAITASLRLAAYKVWSIAEETPSISDAAVLETAVKKSSLLLTEDKDFGELVIRFKKAHRGILLIRLSGIESDEKAIMVTNVIKQYFEELQNSFSVLDRSKLRIKV